MHNIMEGEGANENAVWMLHLLPYRSHQNVNKFMIDPELMDWIGFTVYTLTKWGQKDRGLAEQVRGPYNWAKRNYPTKPESLLEIGRSNTWGQGSFIKGAYKSIERMDRFKLAVYYEHRFTKKGREFDNTHISKKYEPVYAEAISSPHFIGSKKN